MPRKREWTSDEIALLRAMTAEGRSTAECAVHFGVSRQYLRRVRHDLGITPPPAVTAVHIRVAMNRTPAPEPFKIPASRMQNWWPLPAGSPESWGAITRGTCLEGAPYQP